MNLCRLKSLMGKIIDSEYAGLSFLLAAIAGTHFSTIMQPSNLVWDESYYVPEARSILAGTGITTLGHPPLGKLFIASGTYMFGDNPFGWRIFPVLFGLASIWLLYAVCRQLKLSKTISLAAAFLFATEDLSFAMGSIAMLDVFSFTFMLASFYLYLKGNYKIMGLAIALATLCKLPGMLALPVILIHWLVTNRREPRRFILSMLVTPAVFLLLLPLFDLIAVHGLVDPVSQLRQMLSSGNITFASALRDNYDYFGVLLSRPWHWLIHYQEIIYTVNPVYHLELSFALWVLIVPAIIVLMVRSVKKDEAAFFALCWFGVTYFFWVVLTLVTDRTTYLYYFYPSVGAVCIGIALGANWITRISGKIGLLTIGLSLACLVVWLYVFMTTVPGSKWISVPFSFVVFIYAAYLISKQRDEQTVVGKFPQTTEMDPTSLMMRGNRK